jgi:gamma-glutamyltranspeptidase
MPVVFQIVSDTVDYHMAIQDALNAPRVWGDSSNVISNKSPDMHPLQLPARLVGVPPWDEVPTWFAGAPAFPQSTLDALRLLGDPVKAQVDYPQVGGAESIAVDPSTHALSAGADPRGLWAVGHPIVVQP